MAALISAITLVTLFLNPDYNRGILGAAAWFVLGIAYFAFYARKRLILAPEEQFAVSHESDGPEDPAR
jgi:ethanolamine permease